MSVLQAQQPACGGPCWSGGELADYILHLSQADIYEIENALQKFESMYFGKSLLQILGERETHVENAGLNLGIEHVDPSTFPLPTLSRKLDKETQVLHTGRGFFVIRGLDATRYSAMQNTIIYLGVSSYVADQRGVQDRKGNIFCKFTPICTLHTWLPWSREARVLTKLLAHITNSKSWTVPESQRHGIHSSKALVSSSATSFHGV